MNPGRIFVDNVTSPNSGLIWLGNNDGFFFIGDAENEEFNKEMNRFINHVIVPEARKAGLDCFEGIGYCIVYGDLIVSVCFSGFVFENIHCIDIETIEEHQGRKLAQTIAHSFVKDCLENDITPYWDCMELNKSSIAVVENVGFTNVFNYVGYYFPFE